MDAATEPRSRRGATVFELLAQAIELASAGSNPEPAADFSGVRHVRIIRAAGGFEGDARPRLLEADGTAPIRARNLLVFFGRNARRRTARFLP